MIVSNTHAHIRDRHTTHGNTRYGIRDKHTRDRNKRYKHIKQMHTKDSQGQTHKG